MAPPQQSLAFRPAAAPAVVHADPPHLVQPMEQQTTPLPSTPAVPSLHVGVAAGPNRKHMTIEYLNAQNTDLRRDWVSLLSMYTSQFR